MALLKSFLTEAIDSLAEATTSTASMNLQRAVRDALRAGDRDKATRLIASVASGNFAGKMTPAEMSALRPYIEAAKPEAGWFEPVGEKGSKELEAARAARDAVKADLETFRKAQESAQFAVPLEMTRKNQPKLLMAKGFVPVTGQNLNKPGFGIREWEKMSKKEQQRYIDEAATNLVSGWMLDPQKAQAYASFYPRVRTGLEGSGLPLRNIGGIWAVTSAQASPMRNAAIMNSIIANPTGKATSLADQKLALRYLIGDVTDDYEALGAGKRRNFLINSINPEDPEALTADTRYMQNALGALTNYKKTTETTGLFDPYARQYSAIYKEPGLEAARRLGLIPNALQAGAWGNWRDVMAGIPTDLSADLFNPIQGLADSFDADVYRRALDILNATDKESWKTAESVLGKVGKLKGV